MKSVVFVCVIFLVTTNAFVYRKPFTYLSTIRNKPTNLPINNPEYHVQTLSRSTINSFAINPTRIITASLDDSMTPTLHYPVSFFVLLAFFFTLGGLFHRQFLAQGDQQQELPFLVRIFENLSNSLQRFKREFFEVETKPSTKTIEPQSGWKICRFSNSQLLNDKYTLYKFRVSKDPLSRIEAGKKIYLCASDDQGNPIKESFYPLFRSESRQEFEILCDRKQQQALDKILSKCLFSDEIAYKPGPTLFQYNGNDQPIKGLTFIASGSGVVPTIQLVQKILTNEDYQIENCDFLWINSQKEEFILNEMIESLETQYPNKFFCGRVLDSDIDLEESILNAKVKEALPAFEPGRVAVLASSDIIANKFIQSLESLDYPAENIVFVP